MLLSRRAKGRGDFYWSKMVEEVEKLGGTVVVSRWRIYLADIHAPN